MIHIIGAGLAGCIIASQNPESIIYERHKIGGLCRDNENYQDFVHIVHTDNEEVFNFFRDNTTIRNHRILFLSYVKGKYEPWYPHEIDEDVFENQVKGYSLKMWRGLMPMEAHRRIRTSPDQYFFHNKYEFIPDFNNLFKKLLKDTEVRSLKVSHGDIKDPSDKIVLTGPIDEYFHYCYGRLPYRGIKSTHIQKEGFLQADCINIPDATIPLTRLVDYCRLGFKGNWMGIEVPSFDDHYPIRNPESEILYGKYLKLAQDRGLILAGRLATFHYMDIDQVVEQTLKIRP